LDWAAVALNGCRIVRPPEFAGEVEIITAARAPRGFPSRLSQTLGICLKTGPSHGVVSDGKKLVYPADAISVRFPGNVWSCEVAEVGFVSIDIASSLLPSRMGSSAMAFLRPSALPDVRWLAARLARAESRLAGEEVLSQLIARLFDFELFAAEELCAAPAARVRALDRARQFFAAEIERNPSLTDLADATQVNKFALIRSFKRELGITPHRYLVQLRVERARALLAKGVPTSEVAAAVGFADQGHLGRHFKRTVGITPAQYAKQARRQIAVGVR